MSALFAIIVNLQLRKKNIKKKTRKSPKKINSLRNITLMHSNLNNATLMTKNPMQSF